MYQQSIDVDVEKGFAKILNKSEVRGTCGKLWYLPHHPVLNSNKPNKVRRVCNAAANYNNVCQKKAISRTQSITRIDWNNIQISRGTNCPNRRH